MKKVLLLFVLICGLAAVAPYCGPYTTSGPIVLNGQHDLVINAKDITGGSTYGILIRNCYNISVTNCRIHNCIGPAIRIDASSSNITCDGNLIQNTESGIYVQHGADNIKMRYNQVTNIYGSITTLGHAFQLDQCNGSGYEINYNNIDINIGSGDNPNQYVGDLINVYKSNGTSGSRIKVYYNNIRGGGTAVGSKGNAGIVVGDLGGSYQDVKYNNLVNTGYVGIQVQGGTHVTVEYNQIISEYKKWSGVGLATANLSGLTVSDDTIAYNPVLWVQGWNGSGLNPISPVRYRDTSYKAGNGNPIPFGWSTNIVHAAITIHIVPDILIAGCVLQPVVIGNKILINKK